MLFSYGNMSVKRYTGNQYSALEPSTSRTTFPATRQQSLLEVDISCMFSRGARRIRQYHADQATFFFHLVFSPFFFLQVLGTAACTVVSFDFSGSGMSEGDFVTLGYFEQHDVADVLAYLRSNGE